MPPPPFLAVRVCGPAVNTASARQPRQFFLGEALGAGAGGQVRLLKEQEPSAGRLWACKIIRQLPGHSSSADARGQWLHEVAMMLQAKSPLAPQHILFDATCAWYAMVMPVMYGSWQHVLQYVPEIDARQRFELTLHTLSLLPALRDLHRSGVAHRDIKPENILFDARGGLLLTDFGLATTEAQSTFFCGTLGYLAPEMLDLCFAELNDQTPEPYLPAALDMAGIGMVALSTLLGINPFDTRASGGRPYNWLVALRASQKNHQLFDLWRDDLYAAVALRDEKAAGDMDEVLTRWRCSTKFSERAFGYACEALFRAKTTPTLIGILWTLLDPNPEMRFDVAHFDRGPKLKLAPAASNDVLALMTAVPSRVQRAVKQSAHRNQTPRSIQLGKKRRFSQVMSKLHALSASKG